MRVLTPPSASFAATLLLQVHLQLLVAWELATRQLAAIASPPAGFLLENLFLAAAVGSGVRATAGRGWVGSLAGAGAFASVGSYLVADHVHWRLTTRHLQMEPLKEGAVALQQLLGSIAAETTYGVVLGGLATLTFGGWLLTALPRSSPSPRPFRHLLVAFLLLGILAGIPGPTGGLEASLRNPLPILARSILAAGPSQAFPRRVDLDLTTPRFGSTTFPEDHPALAWAEQTRSWSDRSPDIIFLIFESVGATSFLVAGEPDAQALPNLASFAPRALLLPRMYAPFPGTTRSHLHLLTGGHTLTWGDLDKVFDHPFRGPTLPRSLATAGYQSALLSTSYAFHGLPRIYGSEPFDRRNYPFDADAYTESPLNSWGVSEQVLLKELDAWLPELRPDRPAFLMLHNQATHHPYSWPPDHAVPFPVDTRSDRHRAAMHFTDAVLGRLLDRWRAAGRLENTLLVVVGDHGEAFGRRHPTNFIHRDHLYEENIRSFLYLVDFRRAPGELVRAERHGSLGDVFPTLAGLLGLPAPEVPGQDLLRPEARPRIQFFHKFGVPERWGLADGRFKFTLEASGLTRPALFDLEADPTEQDDLSARNDSASTEQLAVYTELVCEWFLRAQEELVLHLEGHGSQPAPDLSERQLPGPHLLSAGTWPEGGRFSEAGKLAPEAPIALKAAGAPYPKVTSLTFVFTDPTGVSTKIRKVIQPGWTTYGVRLLREPPYPSGAWRAAVYEDHVRLAETRFEVDLAATTGPPDG